MQLELIFMILVGVFLVAWGFWFWWDEFGPGHPKHYKWYYDMMEREWEAMCQRKRLRSNS